MSGNLSGDLYTDTTHHHQYVCNAPAGTPAPACTSVTAVGWLQTDGGGTGNMVAATYDPAGSASQVEVIAHKDANSGYVGRNSDGSADIPGGVTTGGGPARLTGPCSTAPGTPGTGLMVGYCDSTQKGFSVKDDAGQVTRTVKPTDCGANFAQKINADGTVTCAAAAGGGGTAFADYQPKTSSITLPLLTETTIFTTTIPGGTLTPGHCLVGSVAFQQNVRTNAAGFYMWVGSVQKHITDTVGTDTYQQTFEICAYTDSAHQQWNVPTITWKSGTGGVEALTSGSTFGIWAALTEDFSTDKVIKFTGYQDTGGGDTVVGLSWRIALQ